jgi:hypothetical protein
MRIYATGIGANRGIKVSGKIVAPRGEVLTGNEKEMAFWEEMGRFMRAMRHIKFICLVAGGILILTAWIFGKWPSYGGVAVIATGYTAIAVIAATKMRGISGYFRRINYRDERNISGIIAGVLWMIVLVCSF